MYLTAFDVLDHLEARSPTERRRAPSGHRSACVDPATFCSAAWRLAAHAFVVSVADIGRREHCSRRISRARQVAMYLSNVAGGVALAQVGDRFGRDRRTAAHACAVVEDMRDDPEVDLALTLLEGALRGMFRLSPPLAEPLQSLPKPRRRSSTHDVQFRSVPRGATPVAQTHGARRMARSNKARSAD